jgi:hypothetical protein
MPLKLLFGSRGVRIFRRNTDRCNAHTRSAFAFVAFKVLVQYSDSIVSKGWRIGQGAVNDVAYSYPYLLNNLHPRPFDYLAKWKDLVVSMVGERINTVLTGVVDW